MAHGQRLALDTNVLLDLAADVGEAVSFYQTCKSRGCSLTAPPTVLSELDYASLDESHPKRQKLAGLVLDKMMAAWDVVPMPEPLEPKRAEDFSLMLRTRRLLPMSERNDGLIVGECSLEGIGILVTSDSHLLSKKMDTKALWLAFADSKLPTQVAIVTPGRMTTILRRSR